MWQPKTQVVSPPHMWQPKTQVVSPPHMWQPKTQVVSPPHVSSRLEPVHPLSLTLQLVRSAREGHQMVTG